MLDTSLALVLVAAGAQAQAVVPLRQFVAIPKFDVNVTGGYGAGGISVALEIGSLTEVIEFSARGRLARGAQVREKLSTRPGDPLLHLEYAEFLSDYAARHSDGSMPAPSLRQARGHLIEAERLLRESPSLFSTEEGQLAYARCIRRLGRSQEAFRLLEQLTRRGPTFLASHARVGRPSAGRMVAWCVGRSPGHVPRARAT